MDPGPVLRVLDGPTRAFDPSSGAVTPRVGKKKEVIEPRPGRWMHHLGLSPLDDVDSKVRA